jgi:predicted enzyme related to lactoylglutathione lyase
MSNNPKENRIDYVEFPATSDAALRASKMFYNEVFGWSFKDWADNYVDSQSSGIASGINSDPSHRPPAPLVVLFTSDLETTKARVIKAGGRIVKDIFPFPGGRRFEYVDPAGNQLAVWSDK